VTRNTRPGPLARSVVQTGREQGLSVLAAAIAYYAFVSIVPLFLLSFAVATAVAGRAFAARVTVLFGGLLTDEASRLLTTALTSGTGRGGATALGLVVLLWSSLRLFRGLDVAFARIYGRTGPVSLVAQLRDAFVVLVAVGAAFGGVATLGAVVPLAPTPLVGLLGPLAVGIVLLAVFFPLYYVFPDCQVTVGRALPGTVLAAAGWTGKYNRRAHEMPHDR
jgi:membrane protein